jgi:hypothetical protein
MSRRKNVVLYFTPESGVTDEQASEMERIPGARQRNAALIDPEAPLEKCDAVAGPAIPENYAEAYPLAKMLPPAEDDCRPARHDLGRAEGCAGQRERGIPQVRQESRSGAVVPGTHRRISPTEDRHHGT